MLQPHRVSATISVLPKHFSTDLPITITWRIAIHIFDAAVRSSATVLEILGPRSARVLWAPTFRFNPTMNQPPIVLLSRTRQRDLLRVSGHTVGNVEGKSSDAGGFGSERNAD